MGTESLFERFVNPDLGSLLRNLDLDRHFVSGNGSLLVDEKGRECLDFVAAFGAAPFGHAHPRMLAALRQFADGRTPNLVQPAALEPAGELAQRLIEAAPGNMRHVCFANSGAEAVEAAIKAARARTGRPLIVSADRGFHGKTLGALSATHRSHLQTPFGAPVDGFLAVPYGDLQALRSLMARRGDDVAAVLLEPIQGEGGVRVPPPGYLAGVEELCRQHGALFALDEVQTGLGRTGRLFAAEAEAVEPDLIALAKALGGGLVPMGACLIGERAYSATFARRHSSTFAANTLGCRIAMAALDLLQDPAEDLLGNVRTRGDELHAIHRRLVARFPGIVAEARGRGLLQGLELRVRRGTYVGGWGTFLGLLGEQGDLVTLLSSYLLNVEGIRTAPTLNNGQTLRVEPPLTVSAAECERYGAAIERALECLATGDTTRLVAHLIGEPRRAIVSGPAQPLRPVTPLAERLPPAHRRFAFLLHAVDLGNFSEFDESLRGLDEAQIADLTDRLAEHARPTAFAGVTIESENGACAAGEFITLPLTARHLMRLPPARARELVLDGVDCARERGAGIVGLGGFTSIVTAGGRKAVGRGIAVTTGNSYTVVAAVEGVELACRHLGVAFERAPTAIVGAGGSVGGALVGQLLPRASELTLVGNPASLAKNRRRVVRTLQRLLPALWQCATGELGAAVLAHPANPGPDADADALQRFAERLLEEDGLVAPLRFTTALAGAVSASRVVFTATNSTEALIQPEMLAAGAIVCDLSRPSNTSRSVADQRPDVLVLDGGVVEIPGRPYLGMNIGFPRGIGYACMAETMMLALDGRFEDTSIGPDLDPATMDGLRGAAKRHGFRIAGLRSFDRLLTGVDWAGLRQGEMDGAKPTAPRAPRKPRIHGAEACDGSIGDAALENAGALLLDRHLNAGRDKATALIQAERQVTYGELAVVVARASALLSEAGATRGDSVAVISHDTIDAVALFVAALRQGIATAFINPFLETSDALALVRRVDPRVVFHSRDLEGDYGQALGATAIPAQELEPAVAAGEAGALPPCATLRAGTPAVCLFSSGSTGHPKAVQHSHRDLINTNRNYVPTVLDLNASDITFSGSRSFFAYGLNSIQFALYAGATAMLAPPRPIPERLFELIERWRPTVFFGVPTVFLLMLERQRRSYDLSSLRRVVSAGEPLPADLFDAWQARFGQDIIDGIGCTESLSTYISNTPDTLRLDSSGRIMPGFDVRLLDADGEDCGDGQIGTMWLRGNTLTRGYSDDAAVTGRAFRDGWFCTNDMFRRDGDGWFHYMGRANDMLKVGGCWVSPAAVESVVRAHPAVSECAVVMRSTMGMLLRPVAYVVAGEGARCGDVLAREIRDHARRCLPPQQYPHFIEFIDRLPKTASGKLQRFRLRNREAQRGAVVLDA